MGLICLGTGLAGLRAPRSEWKKLPTGAIIALAICKLLIMPVIGVLLVDGFVSIKFIASDDKGMAGGSALVFL